MNKLEQALLHPDFWEGVEEFKKIIEKEGQQK